MLDTEVIYRTFQNVPRFQGNDEEYLPETSLRSAIRKHRKRQVDRVVIEQLGMANLANRIRGMLKKGMFSDNSKAKLQFSYLFSDAAVYGNT